MRRRALLRTVGPVAAALIAGCTGSGPGDRSPTPTADSPTSTDSPTPGRTPALVDRSFAVGSNECGTATNRADAHVEGGAVVVTGIIDGSNTCHTARLAGVELADGGDTLRVAVEAYVPDSEETPVCGPCIVAIEYRSTFTFEGGRPDRVVVSHDGEPVAEIPLPE